LLPGGANQFPGGLLPLWTTAFHGAPGKPTSLSGKVSTDGKTLTADKDSRIWTVSNPEVLSGIDGRHVKVKAHMDVAQSRIQILSVSAVAEDRTGTKFGDAAFRR
jgi:hypothetical protein